MRKIKVSKILGKTVRSTRRLRLSIGLIFTGILSIVFIFVTIYGQYTGSYLIAVTDEAKQKGIAISDKRDFSTQASTISFEPMVPMSGVDDIDGSWVDVEAVKDHDGQYYVEGQQYLAYTFYLKNIGQETVNVSYVVKIEDDSKNVGMATVVRVLDYEVNFHDVLENDVEHSKQFTNSNTIADVEIINFKPNDVKKFTFFVWFDGNYSTPEMKGGAIKIEWVFGITSSYGEE